MKKYLSITLLSILVSISYAFGQDMLPSDVYYNENIAVNKVGAEAPTLKIPGDDDDLDPGGGGEGGGGWVGAPIGDATLPLLAVGLIYVVYILYRKRRNTVN